MSLQIFKESDFEPILKKLESIGLDRQTIAKELSFALQHINKSKQLLDCTKESKLKSVVNLANIGLTLNPAAKEAYLVPRYVSGAMECVLEPSYVGLVKLLTDTGSVKNIVTQPVYSGDNFQMDLADFLKPIIHNPCLKKNEQGVFLGVYSVATLPDGIRQPEWMDADSLNEIRGRSETYKAFKAGKIKSCTWETDYIEMCRKTVVRRIYKYLPRTERMSKVDDLISIENEDYTATHDQISYIESLVMTANVSPEQVESIYSELNNMNRERASEVIAYLKSNQQDPVTERGRFSTKDIVNHLNKLS